MNEAAIVEKIKVTRSQGNKFARLSPLFEIAFVLVRFHHIARMIVNANHSIM